MRTHLALLGLLFCASLAQADFRYRSVTSLRWGQSDAANGVGNCTFEDFESTTLGPGMQVHVITGNGSYGPTSTLPSRYVTSVDANGTAFLNSQWSGTSALINTATNQTRPYNNAANWGDIELVFNPPVKIVAFSMYQREVATALSINGVVRGDLGSLTGLPISPTRGGYAVISATGSDLISSILLDNNGGDGFVIDHVAYSTEPDPVVTVTGLTGWGASDAALGVNRAVIEDFEDAQLNPHVSVLWDAPAGIVGPFNVLNHTFNPTTDDMFGTAFRTGVWDGAHGLLTGSDNQSWNYQDGTHWGDVEMRFDRPMALVGFSLQQADADGRLVINGRDVGSIAALSGLSMGGGGRQGYIRIESAGSAVINSVRLNNSRTATAGDGYLLDHLALRGCGSDFNDDGVVDFFDYLDFVSAFATNDPTADFNGDQVIDFFDYLDFVAAFSQGC